jgi:hypothetical protein
MWFCSGMGSRRLSLLAYWRGGGNIHKTSPQTDPPNHAIITGIFQEDRIS